MTSAALTPHGDPALQRHQAETAARHLVRRVPVARGEETVAQVLARLPGQTFDVIDAVYIVDDDRRLHCLKVCRCPTFAHAGYYRTLSRPAFPVSFRFSALFMGCAATAHCLLFDGQVASVFKGVSP